MIKCFVQNCLKNSFAAIGLLTLTGCSALSVGESEYSCPGYPKGAVCKPARTIYEQTNHKDKLISFDKDKLISFDDETNQPVQADIAQDTQERPVTKQSEVDAVMSSPVERSSAPIPQSILPPGSYYNSDGTALRTPAKVITIWIAPWEDQNGSLHSELVVFREIEPRRWVIGEKKLEPMREIVPLQVTKQNTSEKPNLPIPQSK